jgi:ribosome-associated protein
MVHLFEENARNEYSLERLWRDGKQIELNSESFVEAKTGESSDDELV